MKTYPALFYGTTVEQRALRCKWYHVWFHVSYIVHSLYGVWCLFQGWVVGTLGNTLSGCVTQDPMVGPSEACAIHLTHPVHLVVYMSES